jgi:heterodisulfide reductase subunit B
MSYAFFPGCMIPLRLPYMEVAARKALGALGVELLEMPEASCCGDPIAFQSLSKETWTAVAARNLCIAEEMGKNLLTLCSGCYETLKTANVKLKNDQRLGDQINEALSEVGKEFKGTVEVKNLLEVLQEVGTDKIRDHIVQPLKGLRVAAHYGCHLVRPSDVLNFDDPMKPTTLDQFIELTGAESVPYLKKMLCCGAGLRMVDAEKSLKLVEMKLGYVEAAGADCMAVLCPYCMVQYDVAQRTIKREKGANPQVPVFYYAEMLCLAMGIPPKELGLRFHRTGLEPVLKKLELTA